MMRSMYAGVAGLKTHQQRMDVIGNNIANVNTVAYKSQSMTFAELMYQTTQRASGPNAQTGTGGVNARQIGLGVKTAAINTNISGQGATQTTNNPFDIMITGDAFFVVNNGQENFFTRDGSFYVDAVGNLAMTSNGYNVMGWQVDPETMTIRQDTVTPLRIMSPENMINPPEATTLAYMSGILDKNDTNVTSTSGKNVNLQLYDSLGYSYTARLNLKSSDNEGEYSLELAGLLDENNNPVDIAGLTFGSETTIPRTKELRLDTQYIWGTDQLQTKDTPPVPVCTKATITAYLGDSKATIADDAKAKELTALAKAYGFESIEEMENYKVSYVQNDQNNADPTDDSLGYVSVLDVFVNTEVQQTLAGGAAANNKIQDVLKIDDLNKTIISDALQFQGYRVVYDASKGTFVGINGASDVAELNLSALTVTTPDGKQSKFEDIEIDFTATTMYNNNGSSTLGATSGNAQGLGTGRKIGEMIGVSIQTDGMIYATYDNGQTQLLGQIAVAEFANASGLEKQGDNLYSATLNSGEFDGIGVNITANGGYMNTGVLEMSNVDLSAEFTEMITTQRGFQANSRIITVSDTMLEELVNLKR